MKKIYGDYLTDIVRSEYKHFNPTSTQNFNSPNKKIEFNIDFGDGFCMSKFQYYMTVSFSKKDGSAYSATDKNIAMVSNFVPFLFSRIELRKHNQLIDEVEYPGITSTVRSIVSNKSVNLFTLKNAGIDHNHTGPEKSRFNVCGDLHQLGLGFFEDVRGPIYKGGFTITFIRDVDDNCIYRWKSKKADGSEIDAPGEAKVTIEEFVIRVPLIEFKQTSKIMLIKKITDARILPFYFRKWQCIRKTGIVGTTVTHDITNIFRNISNPTFVMVAFQKNTDSGQLRDSSQFTHAYVKNIRVKINDTLYPEELQNLDIENGNFALAYEMLKDFKNVYSTDNDMLYSVHKFMNEKCVYVIDTSKQYENISNAKSNIIVSVDLCKEIKSEDNVQMFVILVSPNSIGIDVINNTIKEI